jgi:hypothetical protein
LDFIVAVRKFGFRGFHHDYIIAGGISRISAISVPSDKKKGEKPTLWIG